MTTPVTDLRKAGEYEEQAEAISGTSEALSDQITEMSARLRNVVIGQRIQLVLLLGVTAAVLAPYISALAGLAR